MARLYLYLSFLVLVALAAAPGALAQGGRASDPTVKAYLRSPLVRVGETTTLIVEVGGAENVAVVAPPRATGVEVGAPSRPSRRESYVSVNGRQRRDVRHVLGVPIRATGTGTFDISPMTLSVDGRELEAPVGGLTLKVVEDMKASELLLFERDPVPARVYEGQPFDVELRFGWDESLRPAGAELTLPWWNGLDGVLEISAPRGSSRGLAEVFVNRGRRPVPAEVLGTTQRDGRQFQLLRLRRRYLASRPGALEYDQGVFEFVQRVRQGNVFDPGETRSFFATLAPARVEVLPVPEEGRPFEWTGAVGVIEATRSIDRRDVDVGDSIKLQVNWTGAANLEFFDPPELDRLEGFEGFRVLGVEDDRDPDRRRVVYDIVPLRPGEQRLPGVPLWVFDTTSESYVKIETEPIPLRVRRVEGTDDPFADLGGDEDVMTLDLRDVRGRPVEARSGGGPSGGAVLLALAAVLVTWPFARRAVRRSGDPGSEAARRRRGARRAYARALRAARDASEQSAALAAYLAARTGEQDEAWVGRDPRAWVRERERDERRVLAVDAAALDELAALQVELDRRSFAADGAQDGQGAGVDPARLLAAVQRLEGDVL